MNTTTATDRLCIAPEFLATDPPRPVPSVLNEHDLAIYLRVPAEKMRTWGTTLKYYRRTGKLKSFKVGHEARYRIEDVREFVANQAEGL